MLWRKFTLLKLYHMNSKWLHKAAAGKLYTLEGPESLASGVYISTCQNIFYNLALEDWIYENTDFTNKCVLLLWGNKPCIVIGRHQNPWVEVNIMEANNRGRYTQFILIGIDIARRKSGGGTVYHDLGNLNCTFFTSKKCYNRKKNLELVVSALKKRWKLNVKVNDRDDIMLNQNYKISGTAAKLGRNSAYHHFTLLMDVDKSCLQTVLQSTVEGIHTTATESVRADVQNLCDVENDITYNKLIEVIGQEYINTVLEDKQALPVYIDPTSDVNLPKIQPHYNELTAWEWRYGWTPKFKVSHTFTKHISDNHLYDITIDIEIKKGCISDINITSSSIFDISDYTNDLNSLLKGQKFSPSYFSISGSVMRPINTPEYDIMSWIVKCIRSMMIDVR